MTTSFRLALRANLSYPSRTLQINKLGNRNGTLQKSHARTRLFCKKSEKLRLDIRWFLGKIIVLYLCTPLVLLVNLYNFCMMIADATCRHYSVYSLDILLFYEVSKPRYFHGIFLRKQRGVPLSINIAAQGCYWPHEHTYKYTQSK